ncbi:MAG: hypothetical protein OEZ06_26960 [Myxococcales bacterium]|nr:hypothetical protein [Myxococcales bacterium]
MTTRTISTSICGLGVLFALAACSGDDGGAGAVDGSDADAAGNGGAGGDDAAGASGGASDTQSSGGDRSGDPSGGPAAGGSAGGDYYVPQFPGAGTAADTAPLEGGALCDAVGDDAPPIPPTVTRCFFGPAGGDPAATIEQALECVEGSNTVHLRLTFDPGFNDNTYGDGSIGWSPKRGHRFGDLTGSDHAELVLVDGNGEIAMQFKIDYLTEDSSAPSGYASLGVTGGDGSVSIGDAAHVIDSATSLDKNLNERGYGDYIEHSPATDENYTANPDTPEWDYRMVFEVWIGLDAFGDAGFAGAFIDYVHASPSKQSSDTIEVMPEECPPPDCDDPNGCESDDPCLDGDPDTDCGEDSPPDTSDPCFDGNPDTFCADGEPPPPPDNAPAYCELYPTDPACNVD